MARAETKPITIEVDATTRVSGLFTQSEKSTSLYVFAPSAGAGITHSFMEEVAAGLAERGVATLRYQFPYMERGSGRTDPPPVCHATVRAAVTFAAQRWPNVPLFAGGRSFGGRMTSQAQALAPLANVHGLIFLGFP